MGLFGKLVDKKVCDVCGEEIKFLGNKKLEDGNLCKNCAAKLSPWFDERRHSTVQQIKEQLDYRESNRPRAEAFNATRTIGNNTTKFMVDENAGVFTVTSSKNLAKENPDILDFSQIVDCNLDIHENSRELKRTVDGKSVSYNPPRYEYSYEFYVTIRVDHPWFSEMRFSLNSGYVNTGERRMTSEASGWTVRSNGGGIRENMAMDEYYKYINMGNELKELVEQLRRGSAIGMKQGSTSKTIRFENDRPIPYYYNVASVGKTPISLTCTGECVWHVEDAALFSQYGSDEEILKQELVYALTDVLNALNSQDAPVPYDRLPEHSTEIFTSMQNIKLTGWRQKYGVAVDSFRIISATIPESDTALLEELRRRAELLDPEKAAEHMEQTMKEAQESFLANGGWFCACGTPTTGKFCPNCGSPRP